MLAIVWLIVIVMLLGYPAGMLGSGVLDVAQTVRERPWAENWFDAFTKIAGWLIYFAAGTFGFTTVWAIVWRHLRRGRLVWIGGAVSAAVAAGLLVDYGTGGYIDGAGRTNSTAFVITLVCWLPASAFLITAAFFARACARFVVRVFFRPSWRSSLRELWTLDGLPVPRD